MKNEITVAEYSKITGLSRKTIYDKIKKGKLVVEERRGEDNRPVKFIQLDCPVDEFRKKHGKTPQQEEHIVNEVNEGELEKDEKEVKNPVNNVNEEEKDVNEVINPASQQGEKAPKAGNGEALSTEQFLLLEIQELREQIKEKDRQLLDFANKFAELAQQSNLIAEKAIHTTGQAQILQAVDKQAKVVGAIEEPIIEEEQQTKKEEKQTKPKESMNWWEKFAYWITH